MIELLINNIDTLILAFVQGAFGSLTPIVRILWRLMFIIFIAVFGYKVIISGRFTATDLIVNSLKIVILLLIATEWDTFYLLVYAMATDMPSDIAGQIMGGASNALGSNALTNDDASANRALSDFYDRSMQVVAKLLESASWREWGLYLYAMTVWLGALGFTGYAAMLIVLSKIAVAILLAIGPLFILLLIFTNTRGLFEGWLRSLLNYAIIPIFVYALLTLLLTIAELPLQNLEANSTGDAPTLTYIGAFIFAAFVSILLLLQIMGIAASVTGGLSLSTMGAGAWGGKIMRRVSSSVPRGAYSTSILGYSSIRHPIQTTRAAGKRLNASTKTIRGF